LLSLLTDENILMAHFGLKPEDNELDYI
jgi:hypothetical protein